MFVFVRDLAGVWADNRFIRANRVLRYKLKLVNDANDYLTGQVERLRVRRAIDRDVRVRAEVAVGDLTAANQNLSWLLTDLLTRQATTQVDAAVVGQRLEACNESVKAWRSAYAVYLGADLAYKAAYNTAYVEAEGPEHLRKPAAELVAAEFRAARDAAEVVWRDAERGIRLAELGLRVATQGATDEPTPDGGGS